MAIFNSYVSSPEGSITNICSMNYCHFPHRCPRLRLRRGVGLHALLLVEGADEFHGHLAAKPGKRWGNPEGNDGKMGEKHGTPWTNGKKSWENCGNIWEKWRRQNDLTARIRLRLVMFECKPSHLVFQCFSSCLVSRSHRLQNVSMLTKKNFEWRRAPGTPSTPHLTFEYPQNRDWRWLKPWFKPKKTTNLRTEPRF